MGIQIALAWSKDCEKELKEMGFEKKEVYIKSAPAGTTKESNKKGDAEFFKMNRSPYQFVTTSFWGACADT